MGIGIDPQRVPSVSLVCDLGNQVWIIQTKPNNTLKHRFKSVSQTFLNFGILASELHRLKKFLGGVVFWTLDVISQSFFSKASGGWAAHFLFEKGVHGEGWIAHPKKTKQQVNRTQSTCGHRDTEGDNSLDQTIKTRKDPEEFKSSWSSRQLQKPSSKNMQQTNMLWSSPAGVFHMAMPSFFDPFTATSLDHLHTLVGVKKRLDRHQTHFLTVCQA